MLYSRKTLIGLVFVLALMIVSASVALSECTTALSDMGARLVALQNNDGGWDWPLDDGNPANASPTNTIGPIGMGLAKAYRATCDASMLTALGKVSTFLLAKTNNFSPSDGYLAAELDAIFGGNAHVNHLNTNFYGALAAGTYNRNGAGTLYDTATYVDSIRTNRASQGIANLAAWDVGIGLVAAASCGVTGTELDLWIAGVKGEIDELDGDEYYDVVGLAGAVYALAFVGEDFDPTAGEHAAASSLADLAEILAGYQLNTGGFTWNSNYVIEDDYNETIQETAYAILALKAVGGYEAQVAAAADYIKSVQLATGGWEDYPGSGENNEISAEGGWGVAASGNRLQLNVESTSIYVKPTGTVVVDLDVLDLVQPVGGVQAMLNFSSTYFKAGTGEVNVVAGGGHWNELIWNKWTTGGDLDVAVGVKLDLVGGTQADATTAIMTLTPTGTEGVTNVVFRPDADPDPGLVASTYLSDMSYQPIWPVKINSVNIYIDGTAPTGTISINDGDAYTTSTSVTLTLSASDENSGVDQMRFSNDNSTWSGWEAYGTTKSWALSSGDGTKTVYVQYSDRSGNVNTVVISDTIELDMTVPTVTINQASGQADPANTSPINFTVVFSESVDDFGNDDVTLSGTAGATAATVTGSGTTYNVAVSGMTGNGTVIASIDAGKAHDAAGNPNTASTSTDNTVTYDTTSPTVTIEQKVGQADPTNASPIEFTVVFSKSVNDFATGDVTLSGTAGATTATVTGSGTTYSVAVIGMTGDGTVIASIDAGKAHDAAGNPNTASTSTDNTVTYDATAPTVTIGTLSGPTGPSGKFIQGDVTFTVTVDASVSGEASRTVKVDGDVVSEEGGVYTYTVGPATANGTHTISVTATDNAGNTVDPEVTETFEVNKNQITGTVSMGFIGAGTRLVTFVLNGATTMTASVDSGGAYKLVDVIDGVTAVSAKTAWTLRQKLTVTSLDGQTAANFTLLGGDLNNSNSVNILDYTVLKTNWLTSNSVADINGDGAVNSTDYDIMRANWFKVGEAE